MKISLILLIILSAGAIPAPLLFSQAYEGSPCTMYSNPELKKQIKNGIIPVLEINDQSYISTYQSWASSSLAPDTKKPGRAVSEEEFDFDERVHRWTCMYTPFSARDSDTRTAWVEGKKDDGIGEILVVKIDASRPVRIWGGIGASPALFKANNRPMRVRVYVLAGKEIDAAPGVQYSIMQYRDAGVVGVSEADLKDINGYQPLPLPRYTMPAGADAAFVAIEILSVYKGSKFRDTGITELGSE